MQGNDQFLLIPEIFPFLLRCEGMTLANPSKCHLYQPRRLSSPPLTGFLAVKEDVSQQHVCDSTHSWREPA